jgi:hypothetical protein
MFLPSSYLGNIGGIHIQTRGPIGDEVGSCVMMYVLNLMKTGSGIQKLVVGIHRHTDSMEIAKSAATCSRWFLACGFYYPEDGGDKFLRNVCSHKIYRSQKTTF